MNRWLRRLTLLMCLVAALMWTAACRKHEHDKVRVHEEQREGDVHEDQPGEMIVE